MSVRIVTFQVANQMLAIPIDKVREVIRYVPVVEAPQWSGLLHGIIHVRNIIIPVLDLRLILSNAPIQNNTKTRIIIVDMFERVVGLIVDQVNDILPLSSEQVRLKDEKLHQKLKNQKDARVNVHKAIVKNKDEMEFNDAYDRKKKIEAVKKDIDTLVNEIKRLRNENDKLEKQVEVLKAEQAQKPAPKKKASQKKK